MNKLHSMLFPKKWSKWIDALCYERSGYYHLIQMKVRERDNCKIFRTTRIDFVNNSMKEFMEFRAIVLFSNTESPCTK